MLPLLVIAACFLAFANGANDNFKGVASLHGSGAAGFRVALIWGTATTLAGSLAALLLAGELAGKFGGRGLVPDEMTRSMPFLLAVALGAALTVMLATRLGFPISTTHALTGALVGAGLAGGNHAVNFSVLGGNFLRPLLLSPLIAVAGGALVFLVLRSARLAGDGAFPFRDRLHFVSAGAVGFARGLNDTPKIAALLLASPTVDVRWIFAAVALVMSLGGLLSAHRVARTMSHGITGMNPGEGFAASITTAAFVTTANFHALPVSTTHVSVGALAGIGMASRRAHWGGIGQIVLSWVVTLPCAAVLAALVAWLAGA